MTDPRRTVDATWKAESARIVAGLTRMVHDVGLAEELAQDALVAALEQWPATGVPDNPGAWLMAIAKRRAVDHIRRTQLRARRHEELARDLEQAPEPAPDDVLRLMFISCHPVLPTEARVALTLRVIGGLSAAEIARAFLVTEPRIAQRIAAAKRTLAEAGVPFELPGAGELAGRLSSVLEVIYLVFNEGYSATAGAELMRSDLCLEALRLGRLLAQLVPDEAEVHGLVALMEIQASRAATRAGPRGEPVPLAEQNRGQWDQLLIRRGFAAMLRAREIGGPPGPYVLQAAIAVCHAHARDAEDTDWPQIAALYEALAHLVPTPIVQLNRAVALGMARGPQTGLDLVDTLLADPVLQDYHLLPGVRGDLLLRLGRRAEARREFERAAALARNATERDFLHRRAEPLPAPGPPDGAENPEAEPLPAPGPPDGAENPEPAGPTLGEAVRAFLDRADLTAATARAYGQTLRRLRLSEGDGVPVAALSGERVAQVFATAWSGASPATWNRHLSAVRTFCAWTDLDDLTAAVDRRAAVADRAQRIDPAQVDALLDRPDVALRERTLWRLLHESAAPITTVLALNVEDLDLDDRRARAAGIWVTWRAATARLLPELLAGRTRGPLFLAGRRPAPARAPEPEDLCPQTGRRRLSYERSEYLFKQATRTLDPARNGYTLRQLRPRPR